MDNSTLSPVETQPKPPQAQAFAHVRLIAGRYYPVVTMTANGLETEIIYDSADDADEAQLIAENELAKLLPVVDHINTLMRNLGGDK